MGLFFGDNSYAPVTSILDENGDQIFETVGILGLSAASSVAYPQHTLENGVAMSDHVIRLQDRVSLRCVLNPDDYIEVYQQIKKLFRENTAFIIQTKTDTYSNLYIENLPHEEDAKNTVSLNLDFVEQMFQSPVVDTLPESEVENPADSDTKQAGNKQAQDVDNKTYLQRIGDFLGSGATL